MAVAVSGVKDKPMTQANNSATQFVGCPWARKNPEQQEYECDSLKHWQILYERHFGPMNVVCMGSNCEVWRAFTRMQKLLRERQDGEEADHFTPKKPPANLFEAKPDKPTS
jgi:hypothetical protein